MENKQLLEKLRSLGYPLLEVQEPLEVNTALADVVKSKNARFLEGFPVMLANAAKQEGFNYAKLRSLLVKHEARDVLERLFLLSLAMYKANDLYFDWVKEYEAKFTTKDKASLNTLMSSLNSSPEVRVGAYRLNVERLNNAFHHYLAGESKEVKDLSAKHEGMSLEFSLSQVFSPKQKELFKKKLKGEVLTKTEREYFSRSVRKKVSALANEQLHRLAQKVNG